MSDHQLWPPSCPSYLLRCPAHESLWGHRMDVPHAPSTLGERLFRAAVVHVVRRKHLHAAVAVLQIIPCKKVATEAPRVLQAAEPVREVWPVLERLEGSLRERVVVRGVRPRVRLGHAE